MIQTLKQRYLENNGGDILIVDPPWNINDDSQNGIRASSRWPHEYPAGQKQCSPPFFMCYACASLQKHGYNAHLTTFAPPRMPYASFLNEIVRRRYNIILVETSSPTIRSDLEFCRDLKERMDCLIGLVGPYATVNAQKCFSHDCVDAVLQGEYDQNAVTFVRTRECRIYEYDVAPDVNSLPFPERKDAILGDILYENSHFGAKIPHQIQMWGSRGCPFHCAFCVSPHIMYNKARYRPRSADNIAAELDQLIHTNGNNQFHVWFDDDTFNIGEKRMVEIALAFKQRKIEYSAMCRADTIQNFGVLEFMRHCGFTGCAVGVESGCQELVDACNKSLDLNEVIKFRNWCRELGIFIHMTFTLGLKGETEETMQRTKDFIRQVMPDSYQISNCAPVQGTPHFDFLEKKGIVDRTSTMDATQLLNVG